MATIGILYPGEMGAAIGRSLRATGHRPIATLGDRSQQTAARADAAGIEALGCLEEVVEASEIIVSLVSPAAALPVARQVAACRQSANITFVDANSISPAKARQIATLLDRRGVRFVDASIHGPASRLAELGLIYLSGAHADRVAEVFREVAVVRTLGDEPGRASAMKMLLSGMVKGLVALFVEMGLAGREADLLDEFLARMTDFYPGIMTFIARTLPTYPRHAARRAEEVSDLQTTLRGLGLEPHVTSAARRVMERLAESDLGDYAQACDDGLFELDDLIELIALHCAFRTEDGLSGPVSRSAMPALSDFL